MQITITEEGGCRRAVRVDVPVEKVAEGYKGILKDYRKHASIPGFRPGKAPENLILKRHEKAILSDLQKQLVSEGYDHSVKSEKLDVVTVVDVSEEPIAADQPFSFTVTLDVAPSFDLPEYKGIPVKSTLQEVTDADVEGSLKELLTRFTDFVEVEGRAVRAGDVALVDYTCTVDGESIKDGLSPDQMPLAEGRDAWISCDADEMLPGLGTGLIGLSPGEEKDVPVTFPAEFVVPGLSGRTGIYHVQIKGHRERVVPALDEDLLKKLHAESEEVLRGRLRKILEQDAAQQDSMAQAGQIERYLLERAHFDLPLSLVENTTQDEVFGLVRKLIGSGQDKDSVSEKKDEVYQMARGRAENRVKLDFMLDRIAEAESLEITNQDLNSAITHRALSSRRSPDDVLKELREKGEIPRLADELRRQKTFQWLLEQAGVEGKE